MKKIVKPKKLFFVLVPLLMITVCLLLYVRGNREESIRDSILAGTYDFGSSDNVSYKEYLAGFAEKDYLGTDVADLTLDGNQCRKDEGSVTYTFNVKQSGLYHLAVEYQPVTDHALTIVRNLYINDKIPFREAEGIVFERLWEDNNKDYLMNTDGNQAAPLQIQKEESVIKNIVSPDYSIPGDFEFYLQAGDNTVTLESVQSDLIIRTISLRPARKLKTYREYYDSMAAADIPVISSDVMGTPITIQGEDAYVKDSPSILPQNNRISTKTQPYHPTYIVYNTIGGESWSTSGDGIVWQIEVPEDGLYKIGLRFRQALNRGFYSIRELRVNGELPFKEANHIQFTYDSDFQLKYLGDGDGDYYFHFRQGTNTIRMTATLSDLKAAVHETEVTVKNLNALYRELTAVMGVKPDRYRDYDILASVPDMVDIMKTEYARLDQVVAMFGESIEGGTKTSDLSQMMVLLEKIVRKPDHIAKYLTALNDRISAMSAWMLNLGSQPLELDYLMVCPDGYRLKKAEGGFMAGVKHNLLAFAGSFTNDFEVKGTDTAEKKKTLDVWITTATRSQYDIVKRMINEHFRDKSYRVKLSMVSADTLLPSTVTGNGPDVAIQLNYSMPTNFAYRNAAYDLSQFPDFDEVSNRFAPGAMEYMEYNGGYYGLPDQMSYPVIYYRKDILKQLGLEVPKTWDELQDMIPYLEAENMSMYMATTELTALGGTSTTSTKQVSPVFLNLLYQNGIELYNEAHTQTNLGNHDALRVFKHWTEFYTKQGLNYTIDIVTRFRTGEVPLIIEDYTYRNKILLSAPEIDGDWTIAPFPGTVREDGTIDNTNSCQVGSCMMIKNSVEKDGMAEEGWDFMKWWTSAETQGSYNIELKAKDGAGAEYPMSNLEALEAASMDTETRKTVMSTVPGLRGIPQAPGSYITGRVISNVFLEVVTGDGDPVDAMYLNIGDINKEIEKKRQEFGLAE